MKIVVTGAAGFIGSCMLRKLNDMGHDDIIAVDRLDESMRWKNLVGKRFADYIDADDLLDELLDGRERLIPDMIIHMGANSATTGTDTREYMDNNYQYTKMLAEFALKNGIPFLYASSAATYGDGECGFSDSDEVTSNLRPMNMYGYSKHLFDLWAIRNKVQNTLIGFKFFNVYGPNEYHKGGMMSLVCKKFDDVVRDKTIQLFKSHRADCKDGEQKRDFIYVKDVVDAMGYFVEHPDRGGIYNLGSGKAHSWNDVVRALFQALHIPLNIQYIDLPEILRDKYQYFTEADVTKLRKAGYVKPFVALDEAVADYVSYLKNKSFY